MGIYKAVYFDLFDTIIDFDLNVYRAVQSEALNTIGLDIDEFFTYWDETQIKALTGVFQVATDRYRHVLQQMSEGEKARSYLPDLLRTERKAILAATRIIPGIPELFQQLLKRGLRLGIISNASAIGPLIIEISGLSSFFEETVFSFIEKLYKPDPAIYCLAADRLGFPTNQIAYVSDGSKGELTGASKAGMDTLRFDPLKRYQEQYLPPGCFDCMNVRELSKRLEL